MAHKNPVRQQVVEGYYSVPRSDLLVMSLISVTGAEWNVVSVNSFNSMS
jgi:hypothetical protein